MIPEPTGVPALDHLLVWGSVLSVGLGVATGLWRMIRFVVRLLMRGEQFLNDWYGLPERPGVPARPGVLERMRVTEGRVERLEHEMQSNGGTSLRDAVDRVNRVLAELLPGGGAPPAPPPAAPVRDGDG